MYPVWGAARAPASAHHSQPSTSLPAGLGLLNHSKYEKELST
jgi:hypothetical protein